MKFTAQQEMAVAQDDPLPAVSSSIQREPDESEEQLKRIGSDSEHEPAKKSKLDNGKLRLIQQSEQFKEDEDGDGNFIFHRTLLLLRQGDSFIHASTNKRQSELQKLDLEALNRQEIPRQVFCPELKQGLSQMKATPSQKVYIKRPSLITWEPEDGDSIAGLVLQEAEVCEALKEQPHPNIARYYGCLVEDGRITGLCFAHYARTIDQWLEEGVDKADRLACYKGLKDGICHLHKIGLAHNDINPSNVMIDSENRPVIIDFDSAKPIGEELGFKAGTVDWELEDAKLSAPETDFYGLEKIREVILKIKIEN